MPDADERDLNSIEYATWSRNNQLTKIFGFCRNNAQFNLMQADVDDAELNSFNDCISKYQQSIKIYTNELDLFK